MRRRKNRSGDQWLFHFNDWMDNGTFHYEEEDPYEEEMIAEEPVVPETPLPKTKATGRFDQFNDEFDGNFDLPHSDYGERDKVKEDESPGSTPPQDEYADEDPYKLHGNAD